MESSNAISKSEPSLFEKQFINKVKTATTTELRNFLKDNPSGPWREIVFDYSFRYKGNVLHYCCYEAGRSERAMLILDNCEEWGIDLSAVDKPYKRMAIHYAAWRGFSKVVSKMLLKMRDEDLVKKEDHFGWTILHWAAYRNQVRVVEKLLSKKGHLDWSDIDKKGRTALEIAEEYECNEVMEILKRYEANNLLVSGSESLQERDDEETEEDLRRSEIIFRLREQVDEQKLQIMMLEKENEKQREDLSLLQQQDMLRSQQLEMLLKRIAELEASLSKRSQ